MAVLKSARSFARTLVVIEALFTVAGCSLALDTDALQSGNHAAKGTGGGGAGNGGAGGATSDGGGSNGGSGNGGTSDGGAAGADAGSAECVSDLDCDDGNGCTVNSCKNGSCAPATPWTGIGVGPIAPTELALSADEIGVPVFTADGMNILLATWYKNGSTTDIDLRKYANEASVGAVHGAASSFVSLFVDQYLSSPGLIIEKLPRRLRTVGAITPRGSSDSQIALVDFDISGASLKVSVAQPMPNTYASPGYDSDPHDTAPQIWNAGTQETIGWVQGHKLWGIDGSAAGVAYDGESLVDFAPLPSTLGGVHAVLETTDGSGATTEVWSKGSNTLASLPGDRAGEPRRGIATAVLNGGTDLTIWSTGKGDAPSLHFAAAICGNANCTTASVSSDTMFGSTGFSPVVSTAALTAMADTNGLAAGYVTRSPDVSGGAGATAFLASYALVPTAKGDTVHVNPPAFRVRSVPADVNGSVPIGRVAIIATPTQQLMVAWVETTADGKHALKTRRFGVRTCQ